MEKPNIKRFEESCSMGRYKIVVVMYNGARAGGKVWQGLVNGIGFVYFGLMYAREFYI